MRVSTAASALAATAWAVTALWPPGADGAPTAIGPTSADVNSTDVSCPPFTAPIWPKTLADDYMPTYAFAEADVATDLLLETFNSQLAQQNAGDKDPCGSEKYFRESVAPDPSSRNASALGNAMSIMAKAAAENNTESSWQRSLPQTERSCLRDTGERLRYQNPMITERVNERYAEYGTFAEESSAPLRSSWSVPVAAGAGAVAAALPYV